MDDVPRAFIAATLTAIAADALMAGGGMYELGPVSR